VAAAWLDYDNDGDLDLFVVNYLNWSFEKAKKCGLPNQRITCSPTAYEGLANLLYRNNGDGTFTDVSTSSGIGKFVGKGMSAAIADFDSNGYLDIFVANDRERNFLFKNLDRRTFSEMGVEVGVALPINGLPIASMGVDWRDLNNDGWPDLTLTALYEETFPLFLNNGHGLFIDFTTEARILSSTMNMSGWGIGGYDFDNDGQKDLFYANSHVSENVSLYVPHLKYQLPNAVLRNQGDGTFMDVSSRAGEAMRVARAHRGCAFGDLNNDGKIDVIVSVIGSQPEVLYNVTVTDWHWILIDLEGSESNRDGIGAKIKLTGKSGLVQYNHVTTSVGYASASDKRVHFGIGTDSQIREVEIHWPSGKSQVLKSLHADQILKVKEE
jgi:hypothetical protein